MGAVGEVVPTGTRAALVLDAPLCPVELGAPTQKRGPGRQLGDRLTNLSVRPLTRLPLLLSMARVHV